MKEQTLKETLVWFCGWQASEISNSGITIVNTAVIIIAHALPADMSCSANLRNIDNTTVKIPENNPKLYMYS